MCEGKYPDEARLVEVCAQDEHLIGISYEIQRWCPGGNAYHHGQNVSLEGQARVYKVVAEGDIESLESRRRNLPLRNQR